MIAFKRGDRVKVKHEFSKMYGDWQEELKEGFVVEHYTNTLVEPKQVSCWSANSTHNFDGLFSFPENHLENM